MDKKLEKVIKNRDARFVQMREAGWKALTEAHYLAEALRLGLRSMKRDPDKHRAAIEFLERELTLIDNLDRHYLEQMVVRDQILYPAGLKAWAAFAKAIEEAKAHLCEACLERVLKAADDIIAAGKL